MKAAAARLTARARRVRKQGGDALRGVSALCADRGSLRGEAAVLVPLFEREGCVHVWLTRRHGALSSHAGEVALPGGKSDPGDGGAEGTALREASEEISLLAEDADVLCSLASVVSKHSYLVTPVVARVSPSFEPAPRPGEVEYAFAVPLGLFLEPPRGSHSWTDIRWRGAPVRSHSFCVRVPARPLFAAAPDAAPRGSAENELADVWGLTAHVCVEAARAAFGREPTFAFAPETPPP